MDKVNSNVDAEGLTLLYAMHWASNLKLAECFFETDCADSFNKIQLFSGWSPNASNWISECANLLVSNEK